MPRRTLVLGVRLHLTPIPNLPTSFPRYDCGFLRSFDSAIDEFPLVKMAMHR